MDHRTDLIRDRAYQIWIAEGQPTDRHAEHWSRAEREIDEEPASEPNQATAIGPASDAAGQFAPPQTGSGNNGLTSAEPRIWSGDGDATRDHDDHSSKG